MSLLKNLCVLYFLCLSGILTYAQQLNVGLTKPQPAEQLPKSNVGVKFPTVKSKVLQSSVLIPSKNGELIFSQGWRLIDGNNLLAEGKNFHDNQYNTDQWFNAIVPGTVLTTLVESNVYPDPYFGLNNLSIPDTLSQTDWWYRIPFSISKDQLKKNAFLIFNGINYSADIWLNGKLLGQIKGAFKRGEFNIKSILKTEGENILAVHILPPKNPGIPHEESSRTGQGPNGGALCFDGPTFISSEGWDWIPGIRDRNIGLWQDVRLHFTNDIKIQDVHVITDLPLPDVSSADLIVKTKLVNTSNIETALKLEGKIDDIVFSQIIKLSALSDSIITFTPDQFKQLKVKNPKLWWPNGYGAPSLYSLHLSATDLTGKLSDQKSITFGIRELSYQMSVDLPSEKGKRVEFNPTSALKNGKPIFDNTKRREAISEVFISQLKQNADANLLEPIVDDGTAPYLVIKVNGQRIFCKGGNWGMDDGMKRVSRERLEPYIKLHKEANFNMIRNWTAESTEEEFYQLCDEYGMLVWNDFWMSTEGYNVEPLDQQLSIENARDVITRFRNHPSIAIWCPRNEGYAPTGLEDAFAELIAKEDGTRLYQGNSRYLNLRPSGPWHYFKQPKDYFNNNAKGFTTEIGTFSVPTASTIKKFIAPEDQWPINDVWYYHDFHGEHAQKDYLKDIDSLYGKAKNLDDFCKKAQLINYNSHRAIFEAWNSKLWYDASGVLLWMSHPAWPSMIWQTYSWDYETHGSYFGSKKACEPIHIQMNLNDNKIVVINTTLNAIPDAKCRYSIYDLSGKIFLEKEFKLSDVAANKLTEVAMSQLTKHLPEVYIARLQLWDGNGKIISINDYLKTNGKDFQALNAITEVSLSGERVVTKEKSNRISFRLTNNGSSAIIGIKLSLINKNNNTQVLPAYFSDGYFNLLPGETRELNVETLKPNDFKVLVESYSGATVFDL
jgi:hypothetical protein